MRKTPHNASLSFLPLFPTSLSRAVPFYMNGRSPRSPVLDSGVEGEEEKLKIYGHVPRDYVGVRANVDIGMPTYNVHFDAK